jgi:predicted nucleic acid-binding protein
VTLSSLEAAIPEGATLVIDTSAVLAYLDGTESVSPAATYLFDQLVRSGRNPARLSAVTVMEALVRPFGAASDVMIAVIETFLQRFPNLLVAPVDYATAREAARIRALTGLPTADAIVIATAIVAAAGTVVANDARWVQALPRLGAPIQLCHLGSHSSP